MDTQQLIVFLFIASSLLSLLTMASVGLLWWFRKEVFNTLKTNKFMWRGYVKARLVKKDNTSIEIVDIPDEDGFIKFKGVAGKYLINNDAVILDKRRIPTFTFVEGETAPVNFQKDYVEETLGCPHCKADFKVNIGKPKSINPGVFDGLILRIKALGGMLDFMKQNKIIFIVTIATLCLSVVICFILWKIYQDGAKMMADEIVKRVPDLIAQYKGSFVV